MTVIFLNLPIPLKKAALLIFNTIGLDYTEGDSLNVSGGIYASTKCLAANIRLENNAYDYEEQYNFSLFVKEDYSSKLATSAQNIRFLSLMIADLLYRNLNIEIAIETDEQLEIYKSG